MRYIITLTSYGHRLESTAPYAICSLLNQSVPPDKIILWLTHHTTIPPILEKLQQVGLEIRFCPELRSYKKLIPALQEFPADVLISADDDVIYPQNWFKLLKNAHMEQPQKILTNRAHEIKTDTSNHILPYKCWSFCAKEILNEAAIFPTGVGGILYPPGSLHHNCLDQETFLSLAPTGDDLWFWAMGRLNETEYAIIKDGYREVRELDPNDIGLWMYNINYGGNDRQMQSILDQFPALINTIGKIKPS